MASGFACYHHCNDLDRPSVATCNKCGKALCAECTDLFRSRKNNKILCIECLNGEIASNEALFARISARRKKEMTMMIVGAILGLILGFALLTVSPVFLLLPFVFGSLGTIWEKSFGTFGWLVGAILFIVMAVISPIMFVVRILSRIKERKTLAEAIAFNQRARQMNNQFLKSARERKSGLTGAEMQKIAMQMQSAQIELLTLNTKMQQTAAALEEAKKSGNTALAEQLMQELANVKDQVGAVQNKQDSMQKQLNDDEERIKKQEESGKALNEQMRQTVDGLADVAAQAQAMAGTKKKA